MAHSHNPTPVSLRAHITNGYIDNDPVRVEIVSGGLDGDVTVVNDEDNPVPTDETLYSGFSVSVEAFSPDVPRALVDDGDSRGFLLFADPQNTGSIFIGSSASTCFIELTPGSRKFYALPNAALVYAYAYDPDNASQSLIIERYY